MKIISWNILAHELMLYFWRSSYGLELAQTGKDGYLAVLEMRMNNIVEKLHEHDSDVICLQEITNTRYDILDGMTTHQYIAQELDYDIAGQGYKNSMFNYGLPPNEQTRKFSMDSGVATLVRKGLDYVHVSDVNDFGKSPYFKSGDGSPFTLDHINGIYVCNMHVRMNYPNISSVNEVYDRISSVLTHTQLQNTIALGDFNAGTVAANLDLMRSKFYQTMFDEQGHVLVEDHVFIGNNLRKAQVTVNMDASMPLLKMGVNKVASGVRWTKPDTKYIRSEYNNKLLLTRTATTDHPIIYANIDRTLPSKRKTHQAPL